MIKDVDFTQDTAKELVGLTKDKENAFDLLIKNMMGNGSDLNSTKVVSRLQTQYIASSRQDYDLRTLDSWDQKEFYEPNEVNEDIPAVTKGKYSSFALLKVNDSTELQFPLKEDYSSINEPFETKNYSDMSLATNLSMLSRNLGVTVKENNLHKHSVYKRSLAGRAILKIKNATLKLFKKPARIIGVYSGTISLKTRINAYKMSNVEKITKVYDFLLGVAVKSEAKRFKKQMGKNKQEIKYLARLFADVLMARVNDLDNVKNNQMLEKCLWLQFANALNKYKLDATQLRIVTALGINATAKLCEDLGISVDNIVDRMQALGYEYSQAPESAIAALAMAKQKDYSIYEQSTAEKLNDAPVRKKPSDELDFGIVNRPNGEGEADEKKDSEQEKPTDTEEKKDSEEEKPKDATDAKDAEQEKPKDSEEEKPKDSEQEKPTDTEEKKDSEEEKPKDATDAKGAEQEKPKDSEEEKPKDTEEKKDSEEEKPKDATDAKDAEEKKEPKENKQDDLSNKKVIVISDDEKSQVKRTTVAKMIDHAVVKYIADQSTKLAEKINAQKVKGKNLAKAELQLSLYTLMLSYYVQASNSKPMNIKNDASYNENDISRAKLIVKAIIAKRSELIDNVLNSSMKKEEGQSSRAYINAVCESLHNKKVKDYFETLTKKCVEYFVKQQFKDDKKNVQSNEDVNELFSSATSMLSNAKDDLAKVDNNDLVNNEKVEEEGKEDTTGTNDVDKEDTTGTNDVDKEDVTETIDLDKLDNTTDNNKTPTDNNKTPNDLSDEKDK